MSRVPRRFWEQKWLLDAQIELLGLDWDHPRRNSVVGPSGLDALADYTTVEKSVTRFDEIAPAFTRVADKRKKRAIRALADGDRVTARENFFVASAFYGSAQWPIYDAGPENQRLNAEKVECFTRFAELSAHRVERVELELDGKLLPGWLHLPRSGDGPHPVMLLIPGMDTFKELQVAMYGDKFLERGFAVIVIDGPGQSETLLGGLTVTPDNFGDVGAKWLEWIASRPDLDQARVGVYGRSFGSYGATVLVNANADKVHAAAGALVNHEPGHNGLMNESSPTFKARFMFMAGFTDEDRFDEFMQGFVLRDRVANIAVPYLAVAGELDQLSPIEHTFELVNRIPGPVDLVVYEGERHSFARAEASKNGPHWHSMIADWFRRRLIEGEPFTQNRYRFIARDGSIEDRTRVLGW